MTALLAPGARIAVVAPSHSFDAAKLQIGLDWATRAGFRPVPLPDLLVPHRRFAGPTALRRQRLVEALSDPQYDAVWMVRGGSGLLQLLDQLPYAELAPRPVLGFSDVTALFCALDRHGDWPLVHAPVLHSIGATDADSLAHLEDLLAGRPVAPLSGTRWADGDVTAPLVGGNLTLLASTCGTAHQLRGEGRLVLLEEIGELPYRVERAVQQLISAGVFEGAAGIVLGEFLGCRPPDGAAWSMTDGLKELLLPLGLPILADVPIGHGTHNRAFVWNRPARLSGAALYV